jgi:hypothetical protein
MRGGKIARLPMNISGAATVAIDEIGQRQMDRTNRRDADRLNSPVFSLRPAALIVQ